MIKLREKIIKANDDILKLQFGCRIKDFLRGEAIIVGIEEYDGESDCYYQFYDKIPKPGIFLSPRGNWDVIGRPITLEDVLRAMPKNERIDVASDGTFMGRTDGDTGIQWILGKPLKDQTEETINFLNEIL